MSVTVLLGASGPREIELLEVFGHDPGFTVTSRCSDGPQLIAAATTGTGQLAIISADFCPVDVDFLTSITVTGCAVILLIERPEHAPLGRVAAEMQIPVAATPAEALEAAREWIASVREKRGGEIADDATGPDSSGNVVAIWGPAGAPGRTSLAIEIASHLAAQQQRTLLIDADPYGGMVAPALGLMDESSGLISATRSAGRGTLTQDELLQNAVGIATNLRALVGIPRPDRWPELTTVALERLWDIARAGTHWVVIDCGFNLESDEELTFDTLAPQRNAATLSALQAASVIIAVGQGDPLGMPRLVRGLSELREIVEPPHLLTAVTRVRSSVAGARAAESVQEILARYAAVTDVYPIPEDRAAFDAALLEGRSVFDIAPDSPATTVIAQLVQNLMTTANFGQTKTQHAALQ